MEKPRLAVGWSARSSVPGPDLAVAALVFYPTEHRPLEARPGQPGLRVARRGMLVVSAADSALWAELLTKIERGAQLVLREPSGRNHEIKLGWIFTPSDQVARYGSDALAGLVAVSAEDALVPWRAPDLDTFDDLSWILPPEPR